MKRVPHRSDFAHYPLAAIAASFSIGILGSTLCPQSLTFLLTTSSIVTTCSLIMLLINRLRIAGGLLIMAFFFAGASLAVLEKRRDDYSGRVRNLIARGVLKQGEVVELTGALNGQPEFARDRVTLSLDVESIKTSSQFIKSAGLISLQAWFRQTNEQSVYRKLDLHHASRIVVHTRLDRSGKYRNPGVSTLSEYLDRKDYDAVGLVSDPRAIRRVGAPEGVSVLGLLYQIGRAHV